jgi:hypothetical protein
MAQGLVTRIGLWIDSKFEDKVTAAQFLTLKSQVDALIKLAQDATDEKTITDLKTRIEKLELYCGLTRRVDPTKPPVEKSAFQI